MRSVEGGESLAQAAAVGTHDRPRLADGARLVGLKRVTSGTKAKAA